MKIGAVNVPSKLALAPMAGVTDAAFRQICAELGAGYTCSELISSKRFATVIGKPSGF